MATIVSQLWSNFGTEHLKRLLLTTWNPWMFTWEPVSSIIMWRQQIIDDDNKQSLVWKTKSSPRPTMFHLQKCRIKMILYRPVVIHKHEPEGQIMNNEFYIHVIKRLLNQILKVSSQFWKKGCWFHTHDNTPAPCITTVKCLLAHHGVVQASHKPCSTYLMPARQNHRPQSGSLVHRWVGNPGLLSCKYLWTLIYL